MKKKPYDRNQAYDPHILESLNKLPQIMENADKKTVTIKKKVNRENGDEHIAVTRHGLQVRDIKLIPSILKNPLVVKPDPIKKHSKNYYGLRKGRHTDDNQIYVKIVTNVMADGSEEIVTVFPTDKIK